MDPDDSNHLPSVEKDKSSGSKKNAKPSTQRQKNNNDGGLRIRPSTTLSSQQNDNYENQPNSSQDINREQSQPDEQSSSSSRLFRTNISHSNNAPVRTQNAVSNGGGHNIVRPLKNDAVQEGSSFQTYSHSRPFQSNSRGGVRARHRQTAGTAEGEMHNGNLTTRKNTSPTRQTGHMRSDKHHSPRRNRSSPTSVPHLPNLRFNSPRDPSPHPNSSSPPLDVMGSPESPLPPMFSHIRPGLYSPHNPFMIGLGTEDNPYEISSGPSDSTGLLSDEEIARQLQEEEWDAAGSFCQTSGGLRSRRNLPSLRRPRSHAGGYMHMGSGEPIPSGSRLVEALDFDSEPISSRRVRTNRSVRPTRSQSRFLSTYPHLDMFDPLHVLQTTLRDSHDEMTPFIYDLFHHYGIPDFEIQTWLNPGAVGDPVFGDYESLLALAERLGEVSRGLSDSEISQLPTSKHQGQTPGGASAMPDDLPQCNICLTDYEHGDRMRNLPCKHDFHKDCVDQWLKTNATCPICRAEVKKKRS
ncbi:unnamed protein product [Lymnaea stagnalis]|uniref:RING-type E3 ubiquitin transferase n=1 Tax=Lymnaea stagnalis TaxID=6523 RepID=A0AAV2I530_LYMST